MPYKPRKRCTRCRKRHAEQGSFCRDCRRARERAIDRARGSSAARGYGTEHRRRFRVGVFRADPFCVCQDPRHPHGDPCGQPSTRADHYPLSRRELEELGLDPNDPAYGRGLCASCDSKQTAERQPGGWNR